MLLSTGKKPSYKTYLGTNFNSFSYFKAAMNPSNFKIALNLAEKYNMNELESVFGNLLKDSFASDFGNDNKINVFESLFVTN